MTEEYLRGVRSFVKREGRLSLRVQKVWDKYASDYVIDDYLKAVDWLLEFTENKDTNYNKVVLEIGSGQGNQLIESAKNNPRTFYIGVEVYRTGVAHTLLLARNAMRNDTDSATSTSTDADSTLSSALLYAPPNTTPTTILPNFKMLMCDASQILRELQKRNITAVFDEVWTFFPDPWPKKRHHKRRLVQKDFRALIDNVLKPTSGVWRLATDWEDYAMHMQSVLEIQPSPRFDGRVLTNFEKKGIDAGREIFDFEYHI